MYLYQYIYVWKSNEKEAMKLNESGKGYKRRFESGWSKEREGRNVVIL